MSKAVAVYDKILLMLASGLTTHSRISNPYKLEENPEYALKAGYGVKIGAGENTARTLGCAILSERRDFGIVLSRKYFAREDDAVSKAVAERELFNDAFEVKKMFELNPQLDGITSNAAYASDTGTNYVFGNKDRFLTTEITISIEYIENLNP